MHPSEIEQLWNVLETQSPKEIEALFNGAPADAIRTEIAGEKRKLDILMKAAVAIKNYEMIFKKQDIFKIFNGSNYKIKAEFFWI